jgi:type I restriction enzyme S subunit
MRSGGTPISSIPEYYGGDIPWVSISDMTKSGKYITSTERNLSRSGLENCSAQIFPIGTVIYAMYASIGECNITGVPLCSSQAILGIRPSGRLDNEFLYYYLTLLKPRLKSLGQHGTQANLNKSIVQNIRFPLPTPAEQQKIAECLSSVDELIAAQARKLDALKTHKKGLMQQLFPREGETQPRLRFPEFQNAGEWASRKLKDLLNTVIDNRGKTPPLSLNGYPLVEVNALGTHKIDYKKVSKFVDETTHEDWFRGHVQIGDVLFSTVGAVAESSVVCAEYQPVIAQNIVGLRFNKTTLHQFGFHLLTALQNKAKFLRITMGAVQPSLKVSQMVQISFRIPRSLPEQQRIADCLSSLDDLIAAQTQTLEALRTHKQGLMQQLFPSPEAVA